MLNLNCLTDIRKLEAFVQRLDVETFNQPVHKVEENLDTKPSWYTMKYDPEAKKIEVYPN